MRIGVTITGSPELQAALERLGEELSSPDILDEAAALLLARTRQRFLEQTDPEGVPWIPSVAAILRAKRGRGGGTLFATGRLFHSIQLHEVGPDSREISSDVSYGVTHQLGLRGMPVRQFLGISDDDTDAMVAVVKRRILEAING